MDPLDDYPEMMTPDDVGAYLQISTVRLAAWRGKQVGPPFTKVGDGPNGAVRYPKGDLRKYLASRTVRPAGVA